MRKYQIVAVCWSSLNFGLASLARGERSIPWLTALLLALSPLVFIFFAEPLAETLSFTVRGWLASDRNESQSPVVVAFIGWLLLTLLAVVFTMRLV